MFYLTPGIQAREFHQQKFWYISHNSCITLSVISKRLYVIPPEQSNKYFSAQASFFSQINIANNQ